MFLRDPAQPFQETILGQHYAHVTGHRLDDDSRDLVRVGVEKGLHRRQVVVWRCQGIASCGRRHARAVGQTQGGYAGTGPHQQHVGVAVVAALELHDLVASGVSPRQAQGTHGGLSSRVDEAHHLYRGHSLRHHLGQGCLQFRGCAVAGPILHRLLESRHHSWMSMAQDQRAPRADVVYVLVAINVIDLGSLASGDEKRLSPHGAKSSHGAINPTRKVLLRLSEKLA